LSAAILAALTFQPGIKEKAMKSNLRSSFRSSKTAVLAIGALAAIAFSASASASCYGYGCGNSGGGNGNTPTPTPTNLSFQVGAGAAFEGAGAGTWSGYKGNVEVFKQGFGIAETTLEAGGNLCGANCANGAWTANAAAGEMVNVNAWAKGKNVLVTNGGFATSAVQLTVQK
jgi:hypothetical protein